VTKWVTEEMARGRREEQAGYAAAGAQVSAMPPGRPDEQLDWDKGRDGARGDAVWKGESGAGYAKLHEEVYDEEGERIGTMRDEPLLRLLMRYDEMESGAQGVTDVRGVRVEMDKAERRLMWGTTGSAVEGAKVARVAAMLHIVHHFTDVAATDGSKGRVWAEDRKRWETRVACGAYTGIQPGDVRGGETLGAAAARWVGEGMQGMSLPEWFEVVDAELAAVLMYLQTVVADAEVGEGGTEGRRCLIMSDCKGAMQMIEQAWRGTGVAGLGRAKRGGILEAICRLRERLGMVVFMYVPAHRGASTSAMADAVAKAHLCNRLREGEAEWLRRKLLTQREGRAFGYELMGDGGAVAPWHDGVFDIHRDAVGAWVRGREAGRVRTGAAAKGTVLVDVARLGLVDTEGNGEWWGEVMRGTGAAQEVERREGRTREVAEEEAESVRRDNVRCGVAAAMRNGGEVRRVTHDAWHEGEVGRERAGGEWGKACRREAGSHCSWARGWRWRRDNTATGDGRDAGEGVGRVWTGLGLCSLLRRTSSAAGASRWMRR